MEMLQGVWKQHLRPRAFVGYGVKIFIPSPPNYVTRSPGEFAMKLVKNNETVGHLPHEYSRILWYYIARGGKIYAWQ